MATGPKAFVPEKFQREEQTSALKLFSDSSALLWATGNKITFPKWGLGAHAHTHTHTHSFICSSVWESYSVWLWLYSRLLPPAISATPRKGPCWKQCNANAFFKKGKKEKAREILLSIPVDLTGIKIIKWPSFYFIGKNSILKRKSVNGKGLGK